VLLLANVGAILYNNFMIELNIYHCGIRGEYKTLPYQKHVGSVEEAEAYISGLPHVKGVEYFYGIAQVGLKPLLIDPTGNRMDEVNQRFMSALFG
jgi:hypothetical protein